MQYPQKIDISDHVRFAEHRSGWSYAMNALSPLHHEDGVIMADFIEKPFSWEMATLREKGVIPYVTPWAGIIHNPPKMPEWFGSSNTSNRHIFSRKVWKQSLPACRGLFTLSDYHKNYLQPLFDFPIVSLHHPTETPELKFTLEAFHANRAKKIVQVGWWLRKFESMHQLQTSVYKKAILHCGNPWFKHMKLTEKSFKKDKKVINLPWLKNSAYDKLLSENIVFLHLYDSSANNAIIECIVRDTPVLVNPLEPVKEYLGEDYPFYFSSLEEAQVKAEDMRLVEETHQFLKNHPIKQKLTQEHFLKIFAESSIYCNL